MSDKLLITVNEYLAKSKSMMFEIPSYQRGYVWGKSRKGNNNDTDSATFFLKSILEGYAEYNNEENSNSSEIFLQGITVSEQSDKIIIIDGQQRTTMLFLIMLYLGKAKDIYIHYAVREESNTFLNKLKNYTLEELLSHCGEDSNEKFQDVYYFKKSIRIIDSKLKSIDKDRFLEFVNDKVRFLYIDIEEKDATSIFTMMNGNKADMLPEEVIKADLLRLVSQKRSNIEENEATRWDANMVRSRYAREWDKWLHWWNRPDVKKFYGTTNVMGLLVQTLYGGKLSYEGFKKAFFERQNKKKVNLAKVAFEKLRKLQKSFEDVFNDYRLRNKIGCILCILNKENKKLFLRDYFLENNITDLSAYTDLVFIGLSHDAAKKINQDDINTKFDYTLQMLSSSKLFKEDKEIAYRLLLRRNVILDSALEREFDFSIWDERSLEHIYPQSKATEDLTELHSIGNMVLLYGHNNSSFSNKEFDDKKRIYFNVEERVFMKSRNLLHSLSVFSNNKWEINDILINKEAFITEFKNHYSQYLTTSEDE